MVKSNTPNEDRNRWRTPPEVFAMLDRKYGPFTLDAAADESNHLCDLWLGPGNPMGNIAEDALLTPWDWRFSSNRNGGLHRVFCNPPYNLTKEFVYKAKMESARGNIFSATLLIPATTDTRWFHEYVWDAESDRPYNNTALAFSVGRIRFLRPDGSRAGTPTHGSMFVTFYANGGQLSLPGVGR